MNIISMDAYIFDLFGTVVTNYKHILWKDMIEGTFSEIEPKKLGEVLKKDHGSEKKCLLKIKEKFHLDWDIEKDQKKLAIIKDWRDAQTFYPNVKKVLIQLLKRGHKLALLSNNNNFCEDVINRLHVVDLFDVIILSHKASLTKPDPRVYNSCLEKLGAKAENTISIGDNLQKDVLAPIKMGMKGILFDPLNKHPNFKLNISNMKELL